MIEWQLLVLFVLAITAIVAILDYPIRQWWKMKRLRSLGRTIAPATALAKAKSGKYSIVENKTSLPGAWWLIPAFNDRELTFDVLNEVGKAIHPVDTESEALMRALGDIKVVALEPFED